MLSLNSIVIIIIIIGVIAHSVFFQYNFLKSSPRSLSQKWNSRFLWFMSYFFFSWNSWIIGPIWQYGYGYGIWIILWAVYALYNTCVSRCHYFTEMILNHILSHVNNGTVLCLTAYDVHPDYWNVGQACSFL